MLEETTAQTKQRAREAAREQGELAKDELGWIVLDVIDDVFPDHTKSRRRRLATKAFLAGVVVGAVLVGAALRR